MTNAEGSQRDLVAESDGEGADANHVFFMHIRTTIEWLSLSPEDRFAFLGGTIRPILEDHPRVSMRFFDSEAFHAGCSDVVMWETVDTNAYQSVVEELRTTKFWGTYFEVVEIVPAIENAYARHYGVDPL